MSKSDNNPKSGKPRRSRWWIKVFFLTLVLSALFSFVSETVLTRMHFAIAAGLLLIFIAVNILCDIMGTAATTCEIEPFQSMAARKIKGAKTALRILKHAEKFDNITNDVVGDICAIVSGAMGAVLAVKLIETYEWSPYSIWISVAVSALMAAIIVSGKAFFKKISIDHSHAIVAFIAKIASVFMREDKKDKKRKGKKE
ncbi:hypothetical protein FACS1894211_11720 [Clostridia bacterium]|nr:hypothetical protein FACS1894211_11720 [Clostridia bacterium]